MWHIALLTPPAASANDPAGQQRASADFETGEMDEAQGGGP
jgi:hypothetical protein